MAYQRKTIDLLLKRLSPDAVVPSYNNEGEDVAMDMTAISVHYDGDKDAYVYGTGWACATDVLAGMFAHPKSSNCKHNYYLTNSVGIIDTKGYRGEIRAVFKHRDSLNVRITNAAMIEWANLPWYKRMAKGSFEKIRGRLLSEFMEDPCKYAPYQPGDMAFQFYLSEVQLMKLKEVEELPKGKRGTNGFGSRDNGKSVIG